MSGKYIFGVLFFLLTACNHNKENNLSQTTYEIKGVVDTIVGREVVTDEIPGSAYRNRAMAYFVIVNKDTSDFKCIFTESKDNGQVGIDLNILYFKASMTYQQRMNELSIILKEANKDFNFDSLTSISYGRLILSGDLAIGVRKQYIEKFGEGDKLADYKTTAKFLKESKLSTDLDSIFKPYSISTESVGIEKLFFATKEEVRWGSLLEIDSTKIPDEVIDCITWVRLKKVKPDN